MKVDGLDIGVRVQSVLVEENRATCVMGHVGATREKLVVNLFRRLLQGNDMPTSCSSLFEGIFFSPTVSRNPVVNADSPFHNRTGRRASTRTVHLSRGSVFSFRCLAKLCCSLLNIRRILYMWDSMSETR